MPSVRVTNVYPSASRYSISALNVDTWMYLSSGVFMASGPSQTP